MALNTTATGLTEIDGVASSSVSFNREVQGSDVRYQLVFRAGNKQVARLAGLTADQVTAALGEENGRAVHWSPEPKGLLKGKALHYAQGVSPSRIEEISDVNSRDRAEDAVLKTYSPQTPATASPVVDMREDTQNERAREIQARQAGNDLRLDSGEVEKAPPAHEVPSAELVEPVLDNVVANDSEVENHAESDQLERQRARESERAAALADLENGFYHVDNKFYHRDNQNRVAFVESPTVLRTAESDAFVAKSMVKLAEARGWDSIKVNGTSDFRRSVWMEAAVRGLQVRGYKPNDVDLAQLKEKQESRLHNSIEQGESPNKHVHERAVVKQHEDAELQGASSAANGEQSRPAQPEQPAEKGVVGVMLSHGAAKYDFRPDEKLSYYARLQTTAGEQILWGVDLKRALTAEGVKEGDRLRLENLGRTAVEVEANVRDDQGQVVGRETITTHRNSWKATHAPLQDRSSESSADTAIAATTSTASSETGMAAIATPAAETPTSAGPVPVKQTERQGPPPDAKAAAEAFRSNSDRSAWVATAEQHPELKNAYGNLAVLTKFAQQRLPDGLQEAFLQRQVQNIARDIEAGRHISPVKIAIPADRSKEKSTEVVNER